MTLCDLVPGAAEFFLSRRAKFRKRTLFYVEKALPKKQILVVMLQFEILIDMIEIQFAQDRSVSRKSFILLIFYFGSINFSANANSFK